MYKKNLVVSQGLRAFLGVSQIAISVRNLTWNLFKRCGRTFLFFFFCASMNFPKPGLNSCHEGGLGHIILILISTLWKGRIPEVISIEGSRAQQSQTTTWVLLRPAELWTMRDGAYGLSSLPFTDVITSAALSTELFKDSECWSSTSHMVVRYSTNWAHR